MKYRLTIAAWFSNFFEKAFVRRVNRLIDIHIARFWHSTKLVACCRGPAGKTKILPHVEAGHRGLLGGVVRAAD
jgi:hypothetical protein